MKIRSLVFLGWVCFGLMAVAQTPSQAWLAAARTFSYGNSTEAFASIDASLRSDIPARPELVKGLNALLLDEQASAAARQLATRRLAWVGDASSIGALGNTAAQPAVGFFAVRALGMNDAAPADEALIALLRGKDKSLAVAAANALAVRRAETAIDALAKASTDPAVAPACWSALAEIASPQAIRVLASLEQASPVWQRVFVAAASRQKSLDGTTIVLLEKLAKSPDAVALSAARILLAGHVPGIVKKLSPALKSGTPAFRRGLAGAFGEFATAEELSGIDWAAAPDGLPFAIRAASARRDPALLPFFKACLDGSAAAEAIVAVGRVGRAEDVLPFVGKLADASQRDAASAALRVAQPAEINRELKVLVENAPDPATKAAALTVLAERGSRDAFFLALGLLDSPDASARKAAAETLALTAGPGDLAPLLERFGGDTKPALRAALRRPLVRAAALDGDPAAASRLLAASLENLPPAGRDDVFAILADLDTEDGRIAIGEFLGAGDAEVRKQAIRALASSRNQSSYVLLRSAAEKATEPSERILALRGWIDAIGANSRIRPKQAVLDYRAAAALATRPEEREAIVAALKRTRGPEAVAFLAEISANPETPPPPNPL